MMPARVSTSQAESVWHRPGTFLIEQASQDFAAETPQPIPDACEYSTGTTTDSESFLAPFLPREARMSLIFGCPVKEAAGPTARERAGVAAAAAPPRRPKR
jgi:hypothetical protein